MTTEAIERATKKNWDSWLEFMESIGASKLSHTDIAAKVYELLDGTIDKAGWWSQAVTVAYEQHIGRRIVGQRADGTFEMNVSKATQLNMKALMDAWVKFAKTDSQIADLISEEPRVSGTEKRLTWRAKGKDNSSIIITSEPKANNTASLIVTQSKLPTQEKSSQAKTLWTQILQSFIETV